MDPSLGNPVKPPTLFELDEALGERMQTCELLGRNWWNWGLASPTRDRRWKTIQALVWDRTGGDDLLSACKLAGKILAQMQIAQTEQICRMPVDALARDLAEARCHLSSREQTILEFALENLAGANVSIGHDYDYTPANLLFENDQLSLVDPPDVLRQGVLLWDFSCFRSWMRRHLWRFSLRRPFDRRRAMITLARQRMPIARERKWKSGGAFCNSPPNCPDLTDRCADFLLALGDRLSDAGSERACT